MTRSLGLIGIVIALVAGTGTPVGAWDGDPGTVRTPCTAEPFPDVPTTNPFCADITWLDEHDIAGGFADGTYRPTATVSRQAMALFLYRLRGAPHGDDPTCSAAPFPDVPVDHPFCGEIMWLADAGIAGGFPDGTYRPTSTVTRQFMAAFLYRMVDAPRGLNPACNHKPFTDVAVANEFCGEIAWLKTRGVVQGAEDGLFRPGSAVTRQAMAGFLHDLDATTGIQGGATPLDFDLDGDADLAFVDEDDGRWYRAGQAQPIWTPREVPDESWVTTPGDYNGNGTWEPATILDDGTWHTGGLAGDIDYPAPTIPPGVGWDARAIPVPGDYDGDGDTDPAWYDTYTGTWHIRGAGAPIAFGTGVDESPEDLADTPAPGDYDGDGDTDIAVYSPVEATLAILGQGTVDDVPLGLPLSADLDSDGADELVVFDPSNGVWRFPDGTVVDPDVATSDLLLPLIEDFDGDGAVELTVFVHELATWVSAEGELGADDRAVHVSTIVGVATATLEEFIRFTYLIEDCEDLGLTCPPAP